MAAKNYTEILALVNAGNQMGLSNTIKRDYGIPLDFTSVQPSFDDAVIYAAENTKAYVGQPLSVGGKLYIINDVAAETKHVVGENEYDNYLVEVGSATEGDGVTIDLEEGVLTLHGFEGALSGYLPRKAEDGTLEWVPISAVVQGDGNKVTTLTSEDASVTITKKTDTDASLVYDLSVVHPDAPEYAVKADERAEEATSTTYHLTKDGENVDVAIVVPDAYDDTALAGRISTIETDYLKIADKYDDTALTARVKALEDEERYDETPLANRVGALETTVGSTESGLVKGLADEITRATEAERLLGERIDGIDFIDASELATELEPYAKTADVNTELAKKTEKSDFEALQGRVEAFLTGTGTEAALDSLQELIEYINTHDNTDLSGILASIQAIENKLAGVDETVVSYVTAAINALKIGDYAKASELTELAGRVATLEAKPFDTYATKIEVENVDKKFADYTTTSDLTSLLADKADADKVVSNSTFEQFQTTNTEAIGAARTGAVADVEAKGYAVATEVAGTYATKQSVTDLNNTITATLSDYAKTADVEAELAKKIETGDIAHTTEETAEGVTVEGTKLNIIVDAFTKAETRQYVADTISQMTGGESAADVLLALNNYKSDNDERVGAIETKNSEQDTAITTAQAQADKGVADAKTANDAIAALTTGAVATNTGDITVIKGRLDTLETTKGDHAQRLTTAESKIAALEAADVTINSSIGTLQGNITTLTNEDSRLAGLIDALSTNKANASDVYTKGEADDAIAAAIAAIPATDLSAYAKTADVNAALDLKANATDVYTIAQADAKFMTQDQVDARLNTLIDAANSEDTITNVTNLVEFVNDNAGDIAQLITDVDTNTKAIAKNVNDIAAINEALAAVIQPKESAEIAVAADGTLSVKEVSVSKLVQGEGETLVLNGGSAK